MKALKHVTFLLDTNILIPLEPTRNQDLHVNTEPAVELLCAINEGQHSILIHPRSVEELEGDRDEDRREMRKVLIKKYPQMTEPPILTTTLNAILGNPSPRTHDEIDNHLLATVYYDAVDYLVTEDRKLHKKAVKLSLEQRVATIDEAISILRRLYPKFPKSPPSIERIICHQINEKDSIFDSLRNDYAAFNEWLRKCKREGRIAWLIRDNDSYSAIAIINHEKEIDGFKGNILKICTFKISGKKWGYGYSELLLKVIFKYGDINQIDYMYITAFNKHGGLIKLFEDFGFIALEETSKLEELILVKKCKYDEQDYDNTLPHEFNIMFGPSQVKLHDTLFYFVPINPLYHAQLFPEAGPPLSFGFGFTTAGNSIRKAYLCHSIKRNLDPGSILMFYRSRDYHEIICIGVVDGTLRSSDPMKILRYVGKRTVYSFDEIEKMCKKEVLAILFRHAFVLNKPIAYSELKAAKVLRSAPQTITRAQPEGEEWLRSRIEQQH